MESVDANRIQLSVELSVSKWSFGWLKEVWDHILELVVLRTNELQRGRSTDWMDIDRFLGHLAISHRLFPMCVDGIQTAATSPDTHDVADRIPSTYRLSLRSIVGSHSHCPGAPVDELGTFTIRRKRWRMVRMLL